MASFKSQLIWQLLHWTNYKKWWPEQPVEIEVGRRKNRIAPPSSFKNHFEIKSESIQNGYLYHLSSKNFENSNHVIYIHGGAYIRGPLIQHWKFIERLINECKVSVSILIYPKTPEHHFKQVYDFLINGVNIISERYKPSNTIWMGDSSGASLVMGLMQISAVRPKQLMLLFPWLDIALDNPSIDIWVSKDPILSRPALKQIGEWFSNGEKLNHPLLSPKNAAIEGWPSINIICGTYDILYPDIKEFHALHVAKGNDVSLYSFDKMIHGFTHISMPEAKKAMHIIKKIIG